MMDSADSSLITLNADPEHGGVRFAVIAALIVAFIACFALLATIIRSFQDSIISDFWVSLSCAGALPLAIGAAGLSEYFAKRYWLSGRSISLSSEGMLVADNPGAEVFYDWNGFMALTKWYFQLSGYRRGGRERRIPSKWYCLCCQVQQDEHRFVAYTYSPKEKAESFLEGSRVEELRPGEFESSSLFRRWFSPPNRPEIPTKILAGKQGHFWLAEKRRWSQGMEFETSDFQALIDELDRRIED
ncbi:MAG: hypothetical protein ACK2T3_15075 [Candidatus Promineifilaceae bacterium]